MASARELARGRERLRQRQHRVRGAAREERARPRLAERDARQPVRRERAAHPEARHRERTLQQADHRQRRCVVWLPNGDRVGRARVLQQRGPSQIQFWFIALVIGIAAGFAALGFRKSIDLLQSTLYRTDDVRLLHTHAEYLPWYWVLLIPVIVLLLVWRYRLDSYLASALLITALMLLRPLIYRSVRQTT